MKNTDFREFANSGVPACKADLHNWYLFLSYQCKKHPSKSRFSLLGGHLHFSEPLIREGISGVCVKHTKIWGGFSGVRGFLRFCEILVQGCAGFGGFGGFGGFVARVCGPGARVWRVGRRAARGGREGWRVWRVGRRAGRAGGGEPGEGRVLVGGLSGEGEQVAREGSKLPREGSPGGGWVRGVEDKCRSGGVLVAVP